MNENIVKTISCVFLLFIAVTSGCMVKVSEDPPQPVMPDKKAYNKPTQSFYQFKEACEQGRWRKAYSLLSNAWRKQKSFEHFRENMKKVGKTHLKNAKVVAMVNTESRNGLQWRLTVMNAEKDKTEFVFIKEDKTWKLNGVTNLQ